MRKDVHATYIMIGTPPSRYGFDNDDPLMEIDEEAARKWEENTGGEAVQERLMLLVSEDELEGASYGVPPPNLLMISYATDSKPQFYIIDSIDVYSLSAVYLIVRSPGPLHPELLLRGSMIGCRSGMQRTRQGSGTRRPGQDRRAGQQSRPDHQS